MTWKPAPGMSERQIGKERQLQKFISSLSEPGTNEKDATKGLHPKSVRNYLSFISGVFAYALRMGVVKENPCPRIVLPERRDREKNIFTIEETWAFLDAFDGSPGTPTCAPFPPHQTSTTLNIYSHAFETAQAEASAGLAAALPVNFGKKKA